MKFKLEMKQLMLHFSHHKDFRKLSSHLNTKIVVEWIKGQAFSVWDKWICLSSESPTHVVVTEKGRFVTIDEVLSSL